VQASIPSSNGVIHGCYGKPGTPQKGQLRVVDADVGEGCRVYENPLSWNQIGPSGPPGPTGPTGPTGPGVKTIAGRVAANGTVASGSGFTSSHLGTGQYRISFPAGTWPSLDCPALVALPFDASARSITQFNNFCGLDGSATVDVAIWTVGTTPVVDDDPFSFIAAQT
jgi:hypothetical protein